LDWSEAVVPFDDCDSLFALSGTFSFSDEAYAFS